MQNAFLAALDEAIKTQFYTVVVLGLHNILNPARAEYFRRTREVNLGKTLEEVALAGEGGLARWKEMEDGFNTISSWYTESDTSGPFVLGDTISFADLDLAAHLIWETISLGEDSEGWGKIKQWNGGRWDQLLKSVERYEDLA